MPPAVRMGAVEDEPCHLAAQRQATQQQAKSEWAQWRMSHATGSQNGR